MTCRGVSRRRDRSNSPRSNVAFATSEQPSIAEVVRVVHLEREGRGGLGAHEAGALLHIPESPAHVGRGHGPRPASVAVEHLGDAAGPLVGERDTDSVGHEDLGDRKRQLRVVVLGEEVIEVRRVARRPSLRPRRVD